MIETIGWIGAIFFALSSFPQAVQVYKTQSTKDISMSMIQLWFWGEVLCLIYIVHNDVLQWPLITNYFFNIL